MIKKLFKNENAQLSIFALGMIFFFVFASCALCAYIIIQSEVLGIIKSTKTQLNALSASIAIDSNNSLRESDLENYEFQIYYNSEYFETIKERFMNSYAQNVKLKSEFYEISNPEISFELDEEYERIKYTFTCKIKMKLKIGSLEHIFYADNIELAGYHNTKF